MIVPVSSPENRADSVSAVARKAMERKTGARGLRTILENTLLEIMYDLPAMENVSKIVVDAAVIEKRDEQALLALIKGNID